MNILKSIFNLVNNGHPKEPVVGITNETADCFYVPFIDYDRTAFDCVLKDLHHLHKIFGCCMFVILQSSKEEIIQNINDANLVANYHVIGLDKMIYHSHLEMLKHTRCDWRNIYRRPPYSARNWVLRVSKKHDKPAPEFVKLVKFSDKCSYQHSLAHLLWLQKMYSIKELNYSTLDFDANKDIEMIEYMTK